MAGISKLDTVHSLLMRLALVVMWLAFAAFHLTPLSLFLAAAWFWQFGPEAVSAGATDLFRRTHGPMLLAILGLLGVSGLTALYRYTRVWRKFYSAFVTPFLFKDINEAVRSDR